MATNIYVVQGLGLGDSDSEFANMCAFTTLAEAEKQVEAFKAENLAEGWENEYAIEELILNN